MRTRTLWILMILVASLGAAETPLGSLEWLDALPDAATRNADGTVTVVSGSEGLTATVSELEAPGVTSDRYVVTGEIRYENVAGAGYVEMWSVFEEGSYFTRTNLDQGPMRALTGSSDWRPIALPFDATGSSSRPTKLIVNVVLPGAGEVTLRPLTLSKLDEGDSPLGGASGGSSFGFWGGLAGAFVGVFAGVLGWLGGSGRARGFVLVGFRVLASLGGVLLVVGVVGIVSGWPYVAYYPPLIVGAVTLLVSVLTRPRLEKRYEELELRRMSALDA